MTEDLNERLLRAIAAAGRSSEHNLDRAHALDRLDEYIERELAGEDVAALMPEIAFLIAVDPEIAQAYTDLRQLIADFPAELPDASFDMAKIAQRLDQTVTLAPHDVVRPLPDAPQMGLPTTPVATFIPLWRQNLPRFHPTYKDTSGFTSEPLVAEVPNQPETTHLEIIVTRKGSGYELSGRVLPSRDELVGQLVHLYRLDLAPDPTATLVSEHEINDFDRFSVQSASPGVYVLALIIGDEVLGTAWLELQ